MINTEWDKKFEIGHELIDQEHQLFLRLIKKASQTADMGETSKARNLLIEIKKYAAFHFFSEENLMQEIDYPDYQNHRAMHNMVLSNIDDMIVRLDMGLVKLDEVVDFLFEWFALHTTSADKQITAFINKQKS